MTNKQLLTNFYLINLQIFIWMKNIRLYKYRRLGKEVQKYIHHTTALVHSDPGANKSPRTYYYYYIQCRANRIPKTCYYSPLVILHFLRCTVIHPQTGCLYYITLFALRFTANRIATVRYYFMQSLHTSCGSQKCSKCVHIDLGTNRIPRTQNMLFYSLLFLGSQLSRS